MSAFGDAFKAARKAGKTTFKFQGKSYHTKTKDEMEKTKKATSVPTPTPRPDDQRQADNSPTDGVSKDTSPKPQQNYPRPAQDVGVASAKSIIGQAAAKQANAPVADTPAPPKPDATAQAWLDGKVADKKPADESAAPQQGPLPEEKQWYAKKGSAISLAIARRRNAPASK
ncbi:hypothetical protein [Rhizobium sp. IMFF44]|uniref:hypothetical protein n=1 Tax=Rhizobium sp. IMFF44 TaxID=3342350 RepID=UPI0035B7FE8C